MSSVAAFLAAFVQMYFKVSFLLFSSAAACDAGLSWGEKHVNSNRTVQSVNVDTSTWPKSHLWRAGASPLQDTWPSGADATSFSATITWEEMSPKSGGNVFVSNFLNEGCGSGYVGAQMHADTNEMFADWAIWDLAQYTTAIPMSEECVRYDGEGHGCQCGVEKNKTWEMNTSYTFNVSLVASNASGAHFKAFIKNERTGDHYKLGEIFTKPPPKGKYNCSRLTVGSSPFQEVYTGGNFTNIVSVKGPTFRGVEGHPADVLPTGASDCYYHHSCYGKDGPANCRNESSSFCMPPNCSMTTTRFASGHTPVPSAYIPPWDKNPDANSSTDCWFAFDTGLSGGYVPSNWGMPIMPDGQDQDHWRMLCCGWCKMDPDCVAAQLYGDQCTLHHAGKGAGPIAPVKVKGQSVAMPMKAGKPPLPGLMAGLQRSTFV